MYAPLRSLLGTLGIAFSGWVVGEVLRNWDRRRLLPDNILHVLASFLPLQSLHYYRFPDNPDGHRRLQEVREQLDQYSNGRSHIRRLGRTTEKVLLGSQALPHYYVYRPPVTTAAVEQQQQQQLAPAIFYLHGGGMCVGLAEDTSAALLMEHFPEAVVASVEYRLAPENKFPAAPDDAVAAFDDFWEKAEQFGVDRQRIVVYGISAGGNLAAVVAQHARDTGKKLLLQALIVPMVSYGASTASFIDSGHSSVTGFQHMIWFWNMYCTREVGTTDPRASPILGELRGLAPAIVQTNTNDPLRDEGIALARALEEAGVETQHIVGLGSHVGGFLMDQDAISRLNDAIRQRFSEEKTCGGATCGRGEEG